MNDDLKRFCLCVWLRLMVKPEATYIVERPSQGHHEENGLMLGNGKYHLCNKNNRNQCEVPTVTEKQMCVCKRGLGESVSRDRWDCPASVFTNSHLANS